MNETNDVSIGKLMARMELLEKRHDRLEQNLDNKLENISGNVSDLKESFIEFRSSIMGGKWALTLVAVAASTIGGLVVKMIPLFKM